jgi:hypothetical protein
MVNMSCGENLILQRKISSRSRGKRDDSQKTLCLHRSDERLTVRLPIDNAGGRDKTSFLPYDPQGLLEVKRCFPLCNLSAVSGRSPAGRGPEPREDCQDIVSWANSQPRRPRPRADKSPNNLDALGVPIPRNAMIPSQNVLSAVCSNVLSSHRMILGLFRAASQGNDNDNSNHSMRQARGSSASSLLQSYCSKLWRREMSVLLALGDGYVLAGLAGTHVVLLSCYGGNNNCKTIKAHGSAQLRPIMLFQFYPPV